MLNIVVDFSKEEIEIKFADSIPAKYIKKAKFPRQDNDAHIHKVQSVLSDLVNTYKDEQIFTSVNLPATYENLLELPTNSVEQILAQLHAKGVHTDGCILLSHHGFATKRGTVVVPVSLVPSQYQPIIESIKADQYTTNILRLADVAERDNIPGHVTIVYNSEDQDSEILFFNEDNIPVAYTKTLLGEGITGLADINANKTKVPIDKRRVKSLSHTIDKPFNVSILPSIQPTEQYVATNDLEQPLVFEQPQPQQPTEQVEEEQKPKKEKKVKEKKEKKPKEKKVKEPKQKKSKEKDKSQDDATEDDEQLSPKKQVPPRVVAVVLTLVFVVVIGAFLSSKMLVDLNVSKLQNNVVTFDDTQTSVPLMTYVSSALTTSGVRANTVESVIDENSKETLTIGIFNIDDNTLIGLQSRLEGRCLVELTELEPSKETEEGNRSVSLKIAYK